MEVLVFGDNQIAMKEPLSSVLEADVERALEHFMERLTRVEAHVTDENAAKSGPADKRCVVEVRVVGLPPQTTIDTAATVEEAVTRAVHKMKRLLDSEFGKLNEKR